MADFKKTNFWRQGDHYVWFSGMALATTLLMVVLVLGVVLVNGMGNFWPNRVARIKLTDGNVLLGEIVKQEKATINHGKRIQLKVGNRDLYGQDFRWMDADQIASIDYPADVCVLERMEYGNFYGCLRTPEESKSNDHPPEKQWQELNTAWKKCRQTYLDDISVLNDKISRLNNHLENVHLKLQKYAYHGASDDSPKVVKCHAEEKILKDEFTLLVSQLEQQESELRKHTQYFTDGSKLRGKDIELLNIVRYYQPNQMSFGQKLKYYALRLKELFLDYPRESNTEGGLFPAIFGTIMLIFLMSILAFPFGVITAIYLSEYAKAGFLVRMVRIAVNNLAGIPSIVYGIFGLGFFIYGIGGGIDQLFFPERLPTPTFGTGGILWASLTLGLLTVPVVIVATEEALGTIPQSIKEGSLALGATKFQTLIKILLPMASPGIMTGFILAMARAAGEVAPLMITGVVKLAPALPISADFPFLHLERKFMHLGFHIYDIGFQSPNVEAAKPMVYVTTLLLLLIVITMSSVAIRLRNKMRQRFVIKSL